jgi:hypothetical protein
MSKPTPPLGPTISGSQNLNSLQVNDRTRIHGILELDTDGIINNNVPLLEGTAYSSESGSAGSTIYPKQSPPIGQSAGNIMRSYRHCKPEFYKQTKEDLDGIASGPGTVGMSGYNRMWGTFHVYQYCPRDQDPNVLPAGTAVQLINPDPASAATFYEEVEVYKWATTDGAAEPVRLPIGITQNEVKADDLVNVCVEGITTCRWFVTGSVNPPPNGLPTTLRTAKRGIPVYTVGLRGETLSGQVLCGPKATHFLNGRNRCWYRSSWRCCRSGCRPRTPASRIRESPFRCFGRIGRKNVHHSRRCTGLSVRIRNLRSRKLYKRVEPIRGRLHRLNLKGVVGG